MSDLYEHKNPHRLYRDKDKAILGGVCAGIANYYGLNLKAVRLIIAACTLFFFPITVVIYVVLVILLPNQPQNLYKSEAQEKFWRGVSIEPANVFSNLSHRFKELEMRLQKMETHVTSKEFEMDRELGRHPR